MIAPDLAPTPSQLQEALRQQDLWPAGASIEFSLHPSSFRRDPSEHRWHYSARTGNRILFHLIAGRRLSALYERSRAFAQGCPDLACRPLFHRVSPDGLEFLGLEHFPGVSLDDAVRSGHCDAARWLTLVRHAQNRLHASVRPSDEGRREAELQALVEATCAQPALNDFDRVLIRTLIQPAILAGVCGEPPVTRWSNGDFAGRNLLLDPVSGAVRLIDYEHAAETHFGDDDWSRLFHFSALPSTLGVPPERETAGAPWREAYCWLRQIHLTRTVQPAPELDGHLAEAASRLLAAGAIAQASPGVSFSGSRLVALAARYQTNTEAILTSKNEQLSVHAAAVEHLSRLLHRERKSADDRERQTLREMAATADAIAPGTTAATGYTTQDWVALRNALERARDEQRREIAYFREALALHCPYGTNLLAIGRHGFNLIAEWWLGAALDRPRTQRFRDATWTIEQPAGAMWIRSTTEVAITGWFRDFDGRPPTEIFARVGRRRVVGVISPAAESSPGFALQFRTRPGLKFIRIYARVHHGAVVLLGCRLLICETPSLRTAALTSGSLAAAPVTAPAPETIDLPSSSDPIASIVIPVYNQTGLTLRCLGALAQNTRGIAFETIVVDDASPEPEVAQLQRVRHLRVHRNATNRGFLSSCNDGARLAHGRYVVLLNNDTIVQPGWLDALLETFSLRPDAGLVGAKLIYPDGRLQEAGGICWRDGSAWNYGRNHDANLPAFNFLRETDYCSAACIAVPADLWRELNGFDPAFAPAYYEDTDLAFRVRAAGRKVYYQPKAVVIHDEGRSNGTDTAAGIKAWQVRNQKTFLQRWAATLAHHEPNGSRVFRARERSLQRRIILVVDHHVPRPDRDAGSRNMMTYLRFLVDAGWSVKFIGDDGLPYPGYTDQLEQSGIEVLVGDAFKATEERWLADHGAELDCVLLSRPFPAQRWVGLVRRHTSAPVLFYGTDLLSRSLRRAYEDLRAPQFLIESCAYEDIERQVFAQVDWILYPSAVEVSWVQRLLPAAKVARLPLLVLDEPNRERPAFSDRSGLLFVGGFGHPPNVDAILHFVGRIWPQLRERDPALRLTLVGSHPTEAIKALAGEFIRVRHDISDTELAALYDTHRVVIVPLRYGGGIKGKVLEAMSLGVPVVTTPIGAEGLDWPRPHLLIADEIGFAEAVVALHEQPALWTALQSEAWRFLASEYSARALRDALTPVLPLTPAR